MSNSASTFIPNGVKLEVQPNQYLPHPSGKQTTGEQEKYDSDIDTSEHHSQFVPRK